MITLGFRAMGLVLYLNNHITVFDIMKQMKQRQFQPYRLYPTFWGSLRLTILRAVQIYLIVTGRLGRDRINRNRDQKI